MPQQQCRVLYVGQILQQRKQQRKLTTQEENTMSYLCIHIYRHVYMYICMHLACDLNICAPEDGPNEAAGMLTNLSQVQSIGFHVLICMSM